MIDAHIHVVDPQLRGVSLPELVPEKDPQTVATHLRQQMQAAGIKQAFAMGCLSSNDEDPLGVKATLELAALVPGLSAIGIINAEMMNTEHMFHVEHCVKQRQIKALKVYLGYTHVEPTDARYRQAYELAEQYRFPVIFHTGDTASPYAKLRYAHPLLIDELAVDHPKVNFVLAHVGNPWMKEAAEVVYENVNVWTDVSGLIVNGSWSFDEAVRKEQIHDVMQELQRAFRYAERPNRFIYGSDWPLVPMSDYRHFIAHCIPEAYHAQLFEENARKLFHC